ncbi:hypothetical protein A2634_01690 [Candidatus Amesbacteria bacterium RIFCSPHIGHO2_01_FULL_48_32]|uniref:Uncharacterized protein n=1 Tax=Candidatus Amesbacteria bacterium RIFCSPLOWO2_01_FULL_48_25 TaxID=1797259 RepID=A0A1F4ZE82_9BACT|nr:MAG: hypothetical protein A2634_01690 [Candidatus Amesbacteria bacterium RIFCSPHIGHO2_01_FULL_48_32]OGD03754.1 MAG: hypothetical protein A2989_03675 [Candidatus Amesbacteria bacterium RIFCSPLOWO2_01_FULL_48_25]HJZ05898.1 hypothetical protein [Patescibacteria group bacterium]
MSAPDRKIHYLKIDLKKPLAKNGLPEASGLITCAEVPEDSGIPFMRIHHNLPGQYPMRLDTGKQRIIDHLPDRELDQIVAQATPAIMDAIIDGYQDWDRLPGFVKAIIRLFPQRFD